MTVTCNDIAKDEFVKCMREGSAGRVFKFTDTVHINLDWVLCFGFEEVKQVATPDKKIIT